MIGAFLDQVVDVKRLEDVPGGNKKTYDDHLTNLACHIQPVDDKESQDITGGFGKNWLLMCDTADIIEGDRVIWDSREYRVMAVQNLSFLHEAHTEVIMRIFED